MSQIAAPSNLPDIFTTTQKFDLQEIKKKPFVPLYNVCFIGHVDAGKSTTVARILFDTGRISPHVIAQYEKEARSINKESFKFAWLMDKTKAERQRGITIEVAHAEWSTKSRYFTIIDAPGHVDFIKNMIVGTSQADLAVLLVDAKKGLLEGSSTEQHVFLARASGINSIVVALNKVNMIPLESRMQTIKERNEEIMQLLNRCGYKSDNVRIVPINAWDSWNIINPDPINLPGYEGPTLIDALDTIPLDAHDQNLPLRLSIQSTLNRIGGTNVVVTGKVISGIIYPGQVISIKPANVTGIVRSIQMHYKNLAYATPGANIGVDLKNVDPKDCTKASIISDAKENTAKSVESFILTNALIKEHPTQVVVGSNIIVHYQTGNACCEVLRIFNVRDLKTGAYIEGEVNAVSPGSLACMELKPDRSIVVEPISLHPRLSRVMLRDCNKTIGFGVVTSVKYSKFEG